VRRRATSGSPFEATVGFCRAVRVGSIVEVAGTAPIGSDRKTQAVGDAYAQTVLCLQIVAAALREVGAELRHVTRTRIMLIDMTHWNDVARAHSEIFADIRPVSTIVQVSRFIDPDWLVEIEVSAVIDDET